MAERRETARSKKGQARRPSKKTEDRNWDSGERIAKYLARCGVASRRDCESLIAEGKVFVNDERLVSPAFKVTGRETIRVGRKIIRPPEPARLWRYHKPAGLITTTKDPEGRPTIFDELPKSLPRTLTIGRLDLTTEGLLLLTNDGELARALELPSNAFVRRYRARAHGKTDQQTLDSLAQGITVEGEDYKSIKATLDRTTGTNNWITVELLEGKNREVRKALEAIGLQVNRLIRTDYGPLSLGDLTPGRLEELPPSALLEHFGPFISESRKPQPTARSKPKAEKKHALARERLGSKARSVRLQKRGKNKPSA